MEADWEFEIGGDAPVIDAAWSGFVDLRLHPDRARSLAEAVQLPALAVALIRLNCIGSPVWTAKCDVWDVDSFDPLELAAEPSNVTNALACYIDLLPHNSQQWKIPNPAAESQAAEISLIAGHAAETCRAWAQSLRAISLSNCRADLIVRRAYITADLESLGVTAYITACGQDHAAAEAAISAALAAVAQAVAPKPTDSARV